MWNDAQADVQPFLQGNESLLWSGRPRTGVRLQSSDILVIPFTLIWCGFAVFWEYTVVHTNAPWFFMLWGIPFVAMGLYMVVGRFFVDAWRRGRTMYAVTSQRVLVIMGNGKSVASYGIKQIPAVTTQVGRDGYGTVVLAPTSTMMGPFLGTVPSFAVRRVTPVLEMIENPKQVAEIITRAQQEAS